MSNQISTPHGMQVVVFSLIDEESKKKEAYGISIEFVREIRLLENITIIPRSLKYIRGVMNLRGQIIPVIDLKQKLGFSSDLENKEERRILVVEIGGSLAGLLVDEVDEVLRIEGKDIESNTTNVLGSVQYIKGIAKLHDRLIIILDLQSLFESTENREN